MEIDLKRHFGAFFIGYLKIIKMIEFKMLFQLKTVKNRSEITVYRNCQTNICNYIAIARMNVLD